jgi:hypothetical protein
MDNNNHPNKVVFDFQSYHTPVTRAIYLGVFLGFITAIVNIAFWSIYINITALGMSSYIVNVQTISFGSILPLVTFGALYATFTHYFKGAGAILTIALFALATLWLIYVVANGDYGISPKTITQFKELVIPLLCFIGIASCIAFPICYKSKKVEDMML